eukprot:TRINITY_DN3902_c0_g1_i7.p1 TRINITY_DN3902_c0_g1~~TRINITY_DN3902_c0_g1_i7.p1  ORF type:complete len:408 (+),score=44.29 TRINITY_DN3902_c0_g1_i7:2-1225(+)
MSVNDSTDISNLSQLIQMITTGLRRTCNRYIGQQAQFFLGLSNVCFSQEAKVVDELHTKKKKNLQQQEESFVNRIPGREGIEYMERRKLQGYKGIFIPKTQNIVQTEFTVQDTQLLKTLFLGLPNSGQNHLFDSLSGQKVQSTHSDVGVFMEGKAQVVLYKSKEFYPEQQKTNVSEYLKQIVQQFQLFSSMDVVLLVISAEQEVNNPTQNVVQLISELFQQLEDRSADNSCQRSPIILVVNCTNTENQRQIKMIVSQLEQKVQFEEVFYISEQNQEGLADLRDYLVYHAQEDEWLMEPSMPQNLTPIDIALEVVREKIYWTLHSDLPYQFDPRHVDYKENADGTLRIQQEIIVRHVREINILCGEDNETIEYIMKTAEQEMCYLFKRRVYLFIATKVRRKQTLGLNC